MKIDNIVIDKNKFDNTLLRHTHFETKEEALLTAKAQKDSFEYVGIQKVYVSEQYNDLRSSLVKTGEVRLSISDEMKKDMYNCLEDYYKGNISDEDLAGSYLSFCEQVGTSGKTRLLDVYENFLNMSRYAANNICSEKAKEISDKYYEEYEHDAVYYDAKYYYGFGNVKEIARSVSRKIAETLDVGKLDFEEREKNTIFNLDGGISFNGKWAWSAENIMNRCTMKNIDRIPPEEFSFFYKENKYKNSEEGVMQIGFGNDMKEIIVPFKAPRAGITGCIQNFNASELCRLTHTETENYMAYNQFIENFDIYTRYYYASVAG